MSFHCSRLVLGCFEVTLFGKSKKSDLEEEGPPGPGFPKPGLYCPSRRHWWPALHHPGNHHTNYKVGPWTVEHFNHHTTIYSTSPRCEPSMKRTAQSKKRPDWDRCHIRAVHWLAKKALRQRLLLVSNQPGTACKSKSLTRAATPDGVQEEGAVMIIGAMGINWNQRHSNKLVKALDARKSLYLLKM